MIRTQVKVFFIVLFLFVILLSFCTWNIFKKENEISKLKKSRYDFYVLAHTIENKHHDFNYIINQYIVNENKKYEPFLKQLVGVKSFEEIQKIKSSALIDLGFDTEEYTLNDLNKEKYQQFFKTIKLNNNLFDVILETQRLSNEVLKLDLEALNVYFGFEKNSSNEYDIQTFPNKQKAIKIIYSEEYNNLNQEIQKNVNDITSYIETLMSESIIERNKQQARLELVAIFLLISIAIMILIGIYYSNNNIIKPLSKVLAWTKFVEKGMYSFENSDKPKNEIGILMTSFHKMAEKIKSNINLLEKISLTDQLTKLHNRRAIDSRLEEAYHTFKRYNTTFSVILLDIDHFKSVNDTYGHDVGDSVLKEFAKILKNSSREVDFVGRWGGEEFLIVCPNTNHDEVKILAEKLRKKVEEFTFKTVGKKTASFGTYEIKEDIDISKLIEKVDEALYKSKNTGRNKVT